MPVPKGVRTRVTPDWFAQYLSTGAGQAPGTMPTHFNYISLYNNSTQGANLFVYGVFPVSGVSVYLLFYFRHETFGGKQADCVRINPSLGAPDGQIYFQDNGTSQIPDTPVSLISAFAGAAVVSDAPLFVVPPGWSLVAGTPSPDSGPACAFTFIPFLDTKGNRPA